MTAAEYISEEPDTNNIQTLSQPYCPTCYKYNKICIQQTYPYNIMVLKYNVFYSTFKLLRTSK